MFKKRRSDGTKNIEYLTQSFASRLSTKKGVDIYV